MGKEVKLLKHHPDLSSDCLYVADVMAELDPIYGDVPFLVFLEAVDCADKGGFARA
jgi:hypothetical protein